MNIKKNAVALLVCAMLFFSNFVTAKAGEYGGTITLIPVVVESSEHVSKDDNASTFSTFSIPFSELPINRYKKSDSYYYITSSDSLSYILSYSPVGNKVNFMLISKADPSVGYMAAFPIGGGEGIVDLSKITAGDYYIAIENDGSNSSNITGNCTFTWN